MLLALAACGGGGSGTDAPSVPTTGQVVKGPLSGALVWADLNGDGLQGAGEPFDVTDEFGNYSLSGVGSASIIASTGPTTVDRSTGLVLDGVTLKAPAGSSVVSPLTTIVEETGLSASAIASALGLPNVDLLSFNPYASNAPAADALAVEKLAQKVMATIRSVASASEGAGLSAADANAIAIQAVSSIVSQQISSGGSTAVDLSSSSVVSAIFDTATAVATDKGADTSKLDAVKEAVSAAIVNVNSAIASVTDLNSTEAKATFAASTTLANETKAAANAGSAAAVTLNNSANLNDTVEDLKADVIEAGGGAGTGGGTGTGGGSSGSTGSTDSDGGNAGGGGTNTTINNAPTGNIIIKGPAKLGNTLTIENTLADIDGIGPFSYQWKANGENIIGATSSSYKVSQLQIGKTISVEVSYTDSLGSLEKMTAAQADIATFNKPVLSLYIDLNQIETALTAAATDINSAKSAISGFYSDDGGLTSQLANIDFPSKNAVNSNIDVSSAGITITGSNGYALQLNYVGFSPASIDELTTEINIFYDEVLTFIESLDSENFALNELETLTIGGQFTSVEIVRTNQTGETIDETIVARLSGSNGALIWERPSANPTSVDTFIINSTNDDEATIISALRSTDSNPKTSEQILHLSIGNTVIAASVGAKIGNSWNNFAHQFSFSVDNLNSSLETILADTVISRELTDALLEVVTIASAADLDALDVAIADLLNSSYPNIISPGDITPFNNVSFGISYVYNSSPVFAAQISSLLDFSDFSQRQSIEEAISRLEINFSEGNLGYNILILNDELGMLHLTMDGVSDDERAEIELGDFSSFELWPNIFEALGVTSVNIMDEVVISYAPTGKM